jgi:SAM-dependent methyltransferase
MARLFDFFKRYNNLFAALQQEHSEQRSMALAVGGDFEAAGQLEFLLLMQHGLQKNHTVIDVGCGSGRLAFQLKDYLRGRYVGIDVVPELWQYAQKLCARDDWKFSAAPGLTIPEPDNSADFVCFFSVFTHLLHEESYTYLNDARRVLKPGGQIVISFLEFALPSHWAVFAKAVNDVASETVHVQFMSRDAIYAWAEHLGLKLVTIYDGDKPHIELDRVVRWESGQEMIGKGNLGQSVCILSKPG